MNLRSMSVGATHAALTAIRDTIAAAPALMLPLALAKQRQARELATVLERELRSSR